MRVVENLTVETREHPRLGGTLHVMRLTEPTQKSRHLSSPLFPVCLCVFVLRYVLWLNA